MTLGSEEKLLNMIKRINVTLTQRDLSYLSSTPKMTLQAVMSS